MNCYKCATPLPDNSRFCNSCGADVSGAGHEHEKTIAVDADPELMVKLQQDIGTEYVVERELGRGGMAIVFLGHDASLGRKVAIKLLPPELTFSAGSGVIDRFKREARTSATLDHPNIIPVYRVSQGQKLFWYVMKYLDGEALDDILRREGQMEVLRASSIIHQTADALDYAHQNHVIHRDIKPANIMVDAKGRVTVTDFGIAKALDANTLTATGSMIGTPYYMSPEQCSGKRVAGASDQYSLGVMAYQMLGGHLPFTGDSLIDIVRKHCMDPVPPLAVLRPSLPPALVTVVEKALSKSPEDRFASTADFARAFDAAARGMDITLPPGQKPAPQRLSKTALVSPIPGAIRDARSGMSGKRLAAIAGVVLVLGGGAALAVLKPWQASSSGAPQAPPSGTELAVAPSAAPVDSATAATDSAPIAPVAAAPTPPPAAATPARTGVLTLQNLPAGATIRADGRVMRGPRLTLDANRSYQVRVAAPGYESWSETVRLASGERSSRNLVAMRRSSAGPAGPAAVAANPPPAPPAAQPQPPNVRPTAPAPAPAPAPGPAAAGAPGFLNLRTLPPEASILLNGRPLSGNPMMAVEVPAGPARVEFRWTDSTGQRSHVVNVTVVSGQTQTVSHRLRGSP